MSQIHSLCKFWCHSITCRLWSNHIQLLSLMPGDTRPGCTELDGAYQLAATKSCNWTVWVTRGVCFECPPICRISHIFLMVLIPDDLSMEDQVHVWVVQVCMHVRCIHTHTHILTCPRACPHTCTRTHVHTHAHMHTHMLTHMHTCTHTQGWQTILRGWPGRWKLTTWVSMSRQSCYSQVGSKELTRWQVQVKVDDQELVRSKKVNTEQHYN